MSIKSTLQAAQVSGSERIEQAIATKIKARGDGIAFDGAEVNNVCYIGPCEQGTNWRLVCYRTETGCDYCIREYDTVCTTVSSESSLSELAIPHAEPTEESESAPQILSTSASFTNYTLYKHAKWIGDKFYGMWSTRLADVCAGGGSYGYINKVQITRGPEPAGSCGGQAIVRIENVA